MTLSQLIEKVKGSRTGIDGKTLLAGIKKMGPEVEKEFTKLPMGLHQATEIMGTRWAMFIDKLNRKSNAISWVAQKFLWLADKVEYAFNIVIEALGGATNAVKIFGVILASAGVVAGVWALTAAFTALTSPITLTVAALAALYLAWDDIDHWLNGKGSLLGDAIGPVEKYKGAIDLLKLSFLGVKNVVIAVIGVFSKLADLFETVWGFVGKLATAVGIPKLLSWADGKAAELGDNIGQWATNQYNQSQANSLLPATGITNQSAQKSVSVTIGNITVPAGTTDQQKQFLQDSAQKTFNDVGYRSINQDLDFAVPS